jgi:NADH-quinone oxidoreductase subunit J
MNILMFYLFASIIVVFSVLTVTSRRILRSAVFLLFVLIATSAFYFMLRYTFLAAAQLALYAGGIVVLIIFSILLTSHISERFPQIGRKRLLQPWLLLPVPSSVSSPCCRRISTRKQQQVWKKCQ